MNVSSAEQFLHDGYPLLRLVIDGREALINSYPKPTLARAGIVFLGPDWAGRAPAIDFEVPGELNNVIHLEGFTRDPVVFALFDGFTSAAADGTFAPGPVPIPA